MKKIAYLLNHPNDVALAALLYKTCPDDADLSVILTNFHAQDKYNWHAKMGKGKWIEPCIQEHDLDDIKKIYEPGKIIDCRNEHDFYNITQHYDILMCRGREIVVFNEIANKTISLSTNRFILTRLLDVFPYYKNLQVFLAGPDWLREDLCGKFQMGIRGNKTHNYETFNKYIDKFKTIDLSGYYYDYLRKTDPTKEKTKIELGLPLDKKIASVSFRMAEPDFSISKDEHEFFSKTKEMMQEFKDKGYYIVTRERLDKPNVQWDIRRGTHNMIDKIPHLVDKKINGHGGFPSLVWKLMYASDILLLSDITGLATYEGILCRLPMYMPYDDNYVSSKLTLDHSDPNPVNPIIREMIKENLIFNKLTDDNLEHFYKKIEDFIKPWYNTNVNLFWREILA